MRATETPSSFDGFTRESPPKKVRCVLARPSKRNGRDDLTVGKEYEVRSFWIGYGNNRNRFVGVVNDRGRIEEYVSSRFEVIE